MVDGKVRISGKPAELKGTQVYSKDFAKAVVECWLAGCSSIPGKDLCLSCATPPLPMFDDGAADYDEDANIRLLFSEPMDWNDDALLHDVASYLANCSSLKLPKSWPRDWL